MTCHNSRAEVPRNDATWAGLTDDEKLDGPHHGVQADLIMGQNQYFTGGVPIPGKHKLIEDTCVTCHMNATQPPDILSYNQTGTNHTFAADPGICVECHGSAGETLAAQVDNEITGYLNDLEDALGNAFMRVLEDHYPIEINVQVNRAPVLCGNANAGNPVTAVTWAFGGHSGSTLDIALQDGTSCTGVAYSDITVDVGTADAADLEAFLLDPANGAEDVLKARWNFGLNYEDETIIGCPGEEEPGYDPDCESPHTHRGVHNHAFSQAGLLGAIAAVNAVAQ
jgi:hypothetical protein